MTNRFGIEKGKPIVLPNGTELRPTEEGVPEVFTQDAQEAEQEIDDVLEDPFEDQLERFERTLADVNVTAKEFNPVMLILAYSMWGLDMHAIARFLNLDVQQVQSVMLTDLFTNTRKELLEAIRYAEASSIHGFLSQQARQAAIVKATGLKSKNEDVRQSAASDILDRTGFRPADRVEHVHRFDDEMVIRYVKDEKAPNIELEIE